MSHVDVAQVFDFLCENFEQLHEMLGCKEGPGQVDHLQIYLSLKHGGKHTKRLFLRQIIAAEREFGQSGSVCKLRHRFPQ